MRQHIFGGLSPKAKICFYFSIDTHTMRHSSEICVWNKLVINEHMKWISKFQVSNENVWLIETSNSLYLMTIKKYGYYLIIRLHCPIMSLTVLLSEYLTFWWTFFFFF